MMSLRVKSYIGIGLILIAAFIIRLEADLPITLDEAKESYTAYSIINTLRDTNGELPQLFFKTDNNYVSTLGVYLRIPAVLLLGFNDFSTRLPSIIFGIASIFVFYLILKKFYNQKLSLLVCLLFSLSPFLVAANTFDFASSAGLFFILLLCNSLIKKKKILIFICCLLAILANLNTIFIIPIILFGFYLNKSDTKPNLKILIPVLILILATALFLWSHFFRNTVFSSLAPSSYTYMIDRRLAVAKDFSPDLPTTEYKINRFALNKAFYFFNNLSQAIVAPFSYEALMAPQQSSELDKFRRVTNNVLPKFFYWELLVILPGIFLILKQKEKLWKILLIGGVVCAIIVNTNSLIFILPVIFLGEGLVFSYLKKYKYIIPAVVVIFIISFVSFYDRFWFHPDTWFNERELRQYQIWKTLTSDEISKNKVFITDRLGEPAYYYLYYHKIDPKIFLQQKENGPVVSNGTQKISKIGNVSFGSFKYFESPRDPDEIWVGLSGDFLGQFNGDDPTNYSIPDGEIYNNIKISKLDNNFFGNELWFVKTVFPEIKE